MNVIIEFLNRTNIFNHVYFYVFGYTLSKLTIPPVVIKNVLVLDSIRFGISHCPDPVPDPVIKKCYRHLLGSTLNTLRNVVAQRVPPCIESVPHIK